MEKGNSSLTSVRKPPDPFRIDFILSFTYLFAAENDDK